MNETTPYNWEDEELEELHQDEQDQDQANAETLVDRYVDALKNPSSMPKRLGVTSMQRHRVTEMAGDRPELTRSDGTDGSWAGD